MSMVLCFALEHVLAATRAGCVFHLTTARWNMQVVVRRSHDWFLYSYVHLCVSDRARRQIVGMSTSYDFGWVTCSMASRDGTTRCAKIKSHRYQNGSVYWSCPALYALLKGSPATYKVSNMVQQDSAALQSFAGRWGLDFRRPFTRSLRQMEDAAQPADGFTRQEQTCSTQAMLLTLLLWCRDRRLPRARDVARAATTALLQQLVLNTAVICDAALHLVSSWELNGIRWFASQSMLGFYYAFETFFGWAMCSHTRRCAFQCPLQHVTCVLSALGMPHTKDGVERIIDFNAGMCDESEHGNRCPHMAALPYLDEFAAVGPQEGLARVMVLLIGLSHVCESAVRTLVDIVEATSEHVSANWDELIKERDVLKIQHAMGAKKKRRLDEDYRAALIRNIPKKRGAYGPNAFAGADNIGMSVVRKWEATDLQKYHRAMLRNMAAAAGTFHLCNDGTRLGRPAKETEYSVLIAMSPSKQTYVKLPPVVPLVCSSLGLGRK